MDKTIKQAKLHGKTRRDCSSYTGSKDVPWLNLSGLWLVEAGFNVGQRIEIRVENGQLTIKALS